MANRNSTQYTAIHVSKYLNDARDIGGRVVPYPYQHTVVSGETGGASAGAQDTVNLCVLPANCKVVDHRFVSDNIWASAGTNGTIEIGDSGDTDRYMLASECFTALGSPTTADGEAVNNLPFAGQNYEPTSDVTVIATWKTANPVVGKGFKGCFFVIPGV